MSHNRMRKFSISRDASVLKKALERYPLFEGVSDPETWLKNRRNFMLVENDNIALFERFGSGERRDFGAHILFEARGAEAKKLYLDMARYAYNSKIIAADIIFSVVSKTNKKAVYFIKNCLRVPVYEGNVNNIVFVMDKETFLKLHSVIN